MECLLCTGAEGNRSGEGGGASAVLQESAHVHIGQRHWLSWLGGLGRLLLKSVHNLLCTGVDAGDEVDGQGANASSAELVTVVVEGVGGLEASTTAAAAAASLEGFVSLC